MVYPEGCTNQTFSNTPAAYFFSDYKNDIGKSLYDYLGAKHVTRGDKAFDVHESTYRVDADVVPVFAHRRYAKASCFIVDTELRPDSGIASLGFSEQLALMPPFPASTAPRCSFNGFCAPFPALLTGASRTAGAIILSFAAGTGAPSKDWTARTASAPAPRS